MAVNALKLRLGAPDSLIIDQGLAGQLDLGATSGGAILKYDPKYFEAMIDQSPMAVAAWRSEEKVQFDTSLPQVQTALLNAAMAYASNNVSTTASGTLTSPSAPTVSYTGTAGTTTYTYEVVAFTSAGDGIPSATGSVTTGFATLDATHYTTIQWTPVSGAAGYKIIRTVGGTTQGLIVTVNAPGVLSVVDTGLTATAYTPSGTQPATPNTDQAFFGGNMSVRIATLDWSVPKNDGTVNRWRGHLNKVFQNGPVEIDYKRDKMSEYKVSLYALADLSQPVGQQAGYIREEY